MKIEPGFLYKGEVKINQISPPYFDNVLKKRVDKIWENERNKNKTLFDGKTLCVDSLKNSKKSLTINAFFLNYRYIVAHKLMENPCFKATVLGTTGVCVVREKGKNFYTLAIRSENNFLAPGQIEVVPSGVIDDESYNNTGQIEPELNLFKEFEEETNLSRRDIIKIGQWHVIFDPYINSVDLCAEIFIRTCLEKIKKSLKNSQEYKNPNFVEKKNITKYINKNEKQTTFLTKRFLHKLIRSD